MNFRHLAYIISVALLLIGCNNSNTESTNYRSDSVKYADGFAFVEHDNFKEITIFEPYKDAIMARYYLVTDSATSTPSDGVRLAVPLTRIGIASSTHIGFLDALGLLDCIAGSCLGDMIYNQEIRQKMQSGEIIDLGDAMQVDPEQALLAHAQAVMISGYGQGDVNPQRLSSVNIKVIYNNEWTERTPLGRAEWIKMVGALFCKEQLADSLFTEIEQRYFAAKHLVDSVSYHPTLMSGNNFRGTWYMSSGDSYMGRFYADAGADYYYQTDSTHGSIPLPIESVIEHFSDAEVWIGSNGNNLKELAEYDPKHTWFKAFQTGRVYNFYRRKDATGANDYWERSVVHPEEVLTDLIWILYPELMPDYEPIYTLQLQ